MRGAIGLLVYLRWSRRGKAAGGHVGRCGRRENWGELCMLVMLGESRLPLRESRVV